MVTPDTSQAHGTATDVHPDRPQSVCEMPGCQIPIDDGWTSQKKITAVPGVTSRGFGETSEHPPSAWQPLADAERTGRSHAGAGDPGEPSDHRNTCRRDLINSLLSSETAHEGSGQLFPSSETTPEPFGSHAAGFPRISSSAAVSNWSSSLFLFASFFFWS